MTGSPGAGPAPPPAGPSGGAARLLRLWRGGGRPDVRTFLAGPGPLAPPELAAVLAVDRAERWARGERVPAEDYLREYPELGLNQA